MRRVANLPAVPGDPQLGADRKDRYQAAYKRTTGYVDRRGAISDGLRMVGPR